MIRPSVPSFASCLATRNRDARSWSGPGWHIESDLMGVELPQGNQPLLQVCTALLQAEVNIVQAYPLLVRPRGRPAVALMVDNIEMGQETLDNKGFTMITEADLAADDE